MSYAFAVIAASKDEAGTKVEAELQKVVDSQPTHAADRQAAQDAVEAIVETLVDPGEGEEIYAYVSGSLGWRSENKFTSANLSIQAQVRPKTT